jgi:hypothetical protein
VGEVGEGAFAGGQHPLGHRDRAQLPAQLLIEGPQLRPVVVRVASVSPGMGRVEPREGLPDVLHIDLGEAGGHPGVRIRFPCVGILGDRQGPDSSRERDARHLGQRGHEAVAPALEVQAVLQHQRGSLDPAEIAGGGFVAMDLSPQLGDRFHPQVLPGHVAGHVGQHGEGGDDQGAVVAAWSLGEGGGAGDRIAAARQGRQQQTGEQPDREPSRWIPPWSPCIVSRPRSQTQLCRSQRI